MHAPGLFVNDSLLLQIKIVSEKIHRIQKK